MPAAPSISVLRACAKKKNKSPQENNLKIRELQRMMVKGKLFPAQGNFHTE